MVFTTKMTLCLEVWIRTLRRRSKMWISVETVEYKTFVSWFIWQSGTILPVRAAHDGVGLMSPPSTIRSAFLHKHDQRITPIRRHQKMSRYNENVNIEFDDTIRYDRPKSKRYRHFDYAEASLLMSAKLKKGGKTRGKWPD